MKTSAKPTIAIAGSVFLLLGVLSQPVKAQGVIDAYLGPSSGTPSASTDLEVESSVTGSAGDYTYNYDVINPTSESVTSFEVGFSASSGNVTSISTGGFLETGIGVIWPSIDIPADDESGVLFSFTSPVPWTMGNANATDNTEGWASTSPDGIPSSDQQVYVPSAVPEPTTVSLLAGGLMFVPFRSLFKKTRNVGNISKI